MSIKDKFKIRPDNIMNQAIVKGMSGRDYTRELVRIRDRRTCQMCDKQWQIGQRRFDIHHLIGCGYKSMEYDKVADMGNLITYCHRCHIRLHSVRNKISTKSGHQKLNLKHRSTYYKKLPRTSAHPIKSLQL